MSKNEMLSIKGRGYSKIHSENPFYEEPQPKAFYHPTQEKQLSQSEKQLALSPRRQGTSKPMHDEQQRAEKQFLSGSHAIKPLPSVQNHIPKSPGSSNFDESWPDSERPSSPSVTAEEQQGHQQSLPYASVRRHAQPTFTSSPIDPDPYAHSPPTFVPGTLSESRADRPDRDKVKETRGSVGVGKREDGGSAVKDGPVLQRLIERFRHGAPMSREERQRMEGNQKDGFWWLESDMPTPNSTSTPKDEGGKSVPFTCQGRGTLTVENLRKRDDLDIATARLQEKAEQILHSAGSVVSSGPVVSTEGLGSTGSDITGSSFSEPLVRPSFFPRERAVFGGVEKPTGRDRDRVSRATSQEDILYRWRLQRKLEAARQGPFVPTDIVDDGAHRTAAEKDLERRLAVFREALMDRGSVAKTHLQQTRLEKDMKQVQCVVDTAVQTSPVKALSSSVCPQPNSDPFALPPSWLPSVVNTSNASQTELPTTHIPKGNVCAHWPQMQTSSSHSSAKESDLGKDPTIDSTKQQRESDEHVSSDSDSVQYRQFLEAEKPQDDRDGSSGTSPRSDTACVADTDIHDRDCGKDHTSVSPPTAEVHVANKDSNSVPPKTAVHVSDTSSGRDSTSMPPKAVHVASTKGGRNCTSVPPKAVKQRDSSHPQSRGEKSLSQSDPKLADTTSRDSHLRLVAGDDGQSSDKGENEQKASTKKHKSEHSSVRNRQGKLLSPRAGSSRESKREVTYEERGKDMQEESEHRVHGGHSKEQLRKQPAASGETIAASPQGSTIMPPPKYTSSPSGPSLSSAIGQVVHDRLFDMSTSVMSSVDSLTSLQHSTVGLVASPQQACLTGVDSGGDSDGEFETDPLLHVLRQQRQVHEAQLRLLDSILAERDQS